MSEITITINGRNYDISCEAGQENWVFDLASYVDQKVKNIANSGAAYNDSHLLVLASLILTDEIFANKGSSDLSKSDITEELKADNSKEIEELKAELTKAHDEIVKLKAERKEILTVAENLTEKVEGLTEKVASM